MTDIWPTSETQSAAFHNILIVVGGGAFGAYFHPALGFIWATLWCMFFAWDLYFRPALFPETEMSPEEEAQQKWWLKMTGGGPDARAVYEMARKVEALEKQVSVLTKGAKK